MTNILLRRWENEDAQALSIAADNSKIAQNMRNSFPSPYTLENARWFINDCKLNDGTDRLARAILFDGKVCGSITVFLQDDVYIKSAELSYWLVEEAWGRGIATRAVKSICRQAFDEFDIVRIYAQPFSSNIASQRVLCKAGFTLDGVMRNGIYKEGKIYSYCVYSLLREECKK